MAEDAKGQRTDLNTAQARVKRMAAKNQTYGKATEQMESQRAVPMGAGPTQVQGPTPGGALFSRPTERPNEPVTNGIDMGDGAGSEALAMRQPDDTNFRAAISSYMPVLAYVSDLPNTSPETRKAIRQLRDQL